MKTEYNNPGNWWSMRKFILWFLVVCGAPVFAGEGANEKEARGQELCHFTEKIFGILHEGAPLLCQEGQEDLQGSYSSLVERLDQYKTGGDPEIVALAEKFIFFFKNKTGSAGGSLTDAVSDLGRLLKCSVDDVYYRLDTAYLLHREDLSRQIIQIEERLDCRLPQKKGANYHKLMMESLADEQYDLALYAYLKIAEGRCK